MPVSIESIRQLNKVSLLAMEPVFTGPKDLGEPYKTPWKVQMYSNGNIQLGGNIESADPLHETLQGVGTNRILNLGMGLIKGATEYSTQIDYAHKYIFQGASKLEFSLTGYLVYEDDPEIDYYQPLDRLAYLTFPSRGNEAINDTLQYLVDRAREAVPLVDRMAETISGAVGAVLTGFSADEDKRDAAWDNVKSGINNYIGRAWVLRSPPTFHGARSGTGLDLRYGAMLIQDVFVREMRVNVPQLYYEGGYPPYLEVTLSLSTMRPITSQSFQGMMRGTRYNAAPPSNDAKEYERPTDEIVVPPNPTN